jgi:hypothetical protein
VSTEAKRIADCIPVVTDARVGFQVSSAFDATDVVMAIPVTTTSGNPLPVVSPAC